MKSFLGLGECMIELSGAGTPDDPTLMRQGFAGDVFNTLWYARAKLPSDWQVAFHTAVGNGAVSDQMLSFFEEAGISTADTPRIEGRNPGLYMIHLDGAERSFSYWRDTSAARLMMRDPDVLWAKVSQADLVYFSGITIAVLPPEDLDILLAGLRSHLKPGAQVAFDPNIRPRLWEDETRMRQAISDAAAISDIVLPSFDDEVACFGDATPEATAARYQALGAGQVVVKNGESPTLVANGASRESFPVAAVSGVVDTTAAGDSFNGAYLAALLETGDPARAVPAAQACAGQVVCTKGALVPFADLAQG